jgi:group II intron reverse transcriptase/maturase
VETRLERIREEAKGNKKWTFSNLIHLVGDEEYLKSCFERLKKRRAAGVDGVTLEQYEKNLDENIRALAERVRRMSYIPQPVRRVYIPKSGGKWRPLGIPATEDKIVQVALARILEAIYEPRFCDGSYGFRNGRSCHDALTALDREIMTKHVNWVLDADIEKFFDSVDHKWMVKCLEQKVKDLQVIRLIVRFLKAGVMEEGRCEETEQGTPQGGIISPILSNIYLHYVVDLWVEQMLSKECRGYVKEIRYADDLVLLLKYKDDGDRAQKLLGDRLSKFGLKLSKEKTRLIEFGRFAGESARKRGEKPATFDFLGFTHFVDKTRGGKFKLGRKTSGKKFGAKVKALKEWIRNIRNRVNTPQLWELLKAKLLGHYSYYGISGNYPMLRVFYRRAVTLVFKWLNRRSQRKSFSWPGLLIYISRYPLPQPKVYHRVYSLSRS